MVKISDEGESRMGSGMKGIFQDETGSMGTVHDLWQKCPSARGIGWNLERIPAGSFSTNGSLMAIYLCWSFLEIIRHHYRVFEGSDPID